LLNTLLLPTELPSQMSDHHDRFPPGVADQLGYYVYRLLDPRTGETFYIGKGKGDRVFAHVRAEISGMELGAKLERIRRIQIAGFEVAHVIHRHGLDEQTAFEVEAALIDAYPGLTVEVDGHGSGDRGVMHAEEIIRRYCAEEAVFHEGEKALLINVNREASQRSIYDAVRYAWVIKPGKAMQASVVLATHRGMIIGAFVADEWLPANAQNFGGGWTDGDGSDGRYGFHGREAPQVVQDRFVGKRVPDRFRKRGAANPVRYTWKRSGRESLP
jgi:hypothetical protein